MMLQPILATLIVIAAAAWLLRRCYLTIRAAAGKGTAGAGQCGGCPRNPTNRQPPVIQLMGKDQRSQSRNDTR